MKALIDNERDDEHFCQVLVFTGQRKEAATKSKVRSTNGEAREETITLISDLFRSVGR